MLKENSCFLCYTHQISKVNLLKKQILKEWNKGTIFVGSNFREINFHVDLFSRM